MTTPWPIGRASPGRLPRRLRDAADKARTPPPSTGAGPAATRRAGLGRYEPPWTAILDHYGPLWTTIGRYRPE